MKTQILLPLSENGSLVDASQQLWILSRGTRRCGDFHRIDNSVSNGIRPVQHIALSFRPARSE
jgi:hypothetical protein